MPSHQRVRPISPAHDDGQEEAQLKGLAKRLEEFGCSLQPAQSYRSSQFFNQKFQMLALCKIFTSVLTVGKYSTEQSLMKYQEETSSTGDQYWDFVSLICEMK